MDRRSFLKKASYATASLGVIDATARRAPGFELDSKRVQQERRLPYKFGMRQASLRNPADQTQSMIADFDTFKVARDIPEIIGVELQVTNGFPNMWDLSVARRYKAEAHRWGLDIPTTAGIWSHPRWGPHAGLDLVDSLRASEIVGASIMLVAFFRGDSPDMTREESYGPVVSILSAVAPRAEDAGIILGLENSLSPMDNKILIEMIDHPAVKVYYDVDNMYFYGHGESAVSGIRLLGNELIVAVHTKNERRLLKEEGRIDWKAAFEELTAIGYDGWIIFEEQYESHEECKQMVADDIAFIKQHFTPPHI